MPYSPAIMIDASARQHRDTVRETCLWASGFAIAILSAGLALATALARGPWYDEFATYYYSAPENSWSQIVSLWRGETNPPLFYAGLYLIRACLSINIPDLRILNALPLILTLAYTFS